VGLQGDDSQQLLAEVYGWFTEGFDTVDLQECQGAAGDAGARVRPPGSAFESQGVWRVEQPADGESSGQIFCTYKSFNINGAVLSFGKPFFGHLFVYPS
jgi:hypothetical protein